MNALSRIDEDMARYGENTMVYRVVRQKLSILAYRLENIERGWKRWCECVSPNLEWHGLGRERIYEPIAEDYLNGSKTLQLWLFANGAAQIVVRVTVTMYLSRHGVKGNTMGYSSERWAARSTSHTATPSPMPGRSIGRQTI